MDFSHFDALAVRESGHSTSWRKLNKKRFSNFAPSSCYRLSFPSDIDLKPWRLSPALEIPVRGGADSLINELESCIFRYGMLHGLS